MNSVAKRLTEFCGNFKTRCPLRFLSIPCISVFEADERSSTVAVARIAAVFHIASAKVEGVLYFAAHDWRLATSLWRLNVNLSGKNDRRLLPDFGLAPAQDFATQIGGGGERFIVQGQVHFCNLYLRICNLNVILYGF